MYKKISAFLLFSLTLQVSPVLNSVTNAIEMDETFFQTDWSGGAGQNNWEDETKFESIEGVGFYTKNGDLRMKIGADVVIGQNDFVTNLPNKGGAVSASSSYGPQGAFIDDNVFIITDQNNYRALIYNSAPTANGASADVVIGQDNFDTRLLNKGGTPDADTLNYITGAFVDKNGKLFIADFSNHRVLIYNSIPKTNGASADVVVGQDTFGARSPNKGMATSSSSSLNSPLAVYSDGEKLYIVDHGNHRALIYNSIPTTNGVSADVVIGQDDFITNSANKGGAVNGTSLKNPNGVFVKDNKLFISDSQNHRVLIYNSIPKTNGASADVVIGQENLLTGVANGGGPVFASTLNSPESVFYDGKRIFIADGRNDRLLIYNNLPKDNGVDADEVIGQEDFLTNGINKGGGVNFDTMYRPASSMVNSNFLSISDRINYRTILIKKNQKTSSLTSSVFISAEERDWGPIYWDAKTTEYSDVKIEVSMDKGESWVEVRNEQDYVGRGKTIQYRATLISKDGLSTPTLHSVSFGEKESENNFSSFIKSIFSKTKDKISGGKVRITKHNPTLKGEDKKLVNGKVIIYKGKSKVKELKIDELGKWNYDIDLKHNKTYDLKIKYIDAHNTLLDTEEFSVKVDSEDPVFTEFPKSNLYKKRGDKMWWKATDNDEIKKYKVYFNGRIETTYDPSFIIPKDIKPGKYNLKVKAYDKTGNNVEQKIDISVM